MSTEEIQDLPMEDLRKLAFSKQWRWAIVAMGFAIFLVIIGLLGLYVLRNNDAAERARKDALVTIQEDYKNCQAANVSRADLRDLLDYIANPNPVDPNVIPDGAEPYFKLGLETAQARARDFRSKHVNSWQPRDCDKERQDALSSRDLGDGF